MTQWINRPYRGDADRDTLLDLLPASRTAATLNDFPTLADMRELLSMTVIDPQANLRLWQDADGWLIGYGMLHMPYGNLLFDTLPLASRNVLANEIIVWGIARAHDVRRTQGTFDTLDAYSRDDDAERVALLEQHSFAQGSDYVLAMERVLDEPLPEPVLPEAWTLRTLAGPDEVPAYVSLHRAAFGTENMTVDQRMAMLHDPDYRQDLDLLAVAPDNTLVAFCVCSYRPEQNARLGHNQGEIDIIGTHPEWKDRGIGRAILLAGLQRLQASGASVATLGVSSENLVARHLYESIGFTTAAIRRWYSRPLS